MGVTVEPNPESSAASARFRSAGPTRANSGVRRCAVTPPDAEIVGLAPPRLRSGLARRRMGGPARGPITSPRGVRRVERGGGGVAVSFAASWSLGCAVLPLPRRGGGHGEWEPGVGVYMQIHDTPGDAAAEASEGSGEQRGMRVGFLAPA